MGTATLSPDLRPRSGPLSEWGGVHRQPLHVPFALVTPEPFHLLRTQTE